ncbi:phosphotransferase [Rossellomorea vietnamensis]|uniref:phosphotransferase n=1 Tax=Rossellomorea vietnamensis TaxID=218284 RepID=UPI003D2CB1A2
MEHLRELCRQTHLGEWIIEPVKVSGGLLHTMYAVETTKGKYAVKALNPSIMKRPDALGNYILSERVARLASKNVPALPAKMFDGNVIQKVGEQWFLVFDWVEGRSVKQEEIGNEHCRMIGSLLADIHHTDFQELEIEPEETEVRPSIDWNAYLQKGQVMKAEWVKSFEDIIKNLFEWDAVAREAESRPGSDMMMSHRDLDPKNVMWVQGEPVVIDWSRRVLSIRCMI